MKIVTDDQILDHEFRAKVIKEITDTENVKRKNKELRKYEIYRDKIKKWVVDSLIKEGLAGDTLMLMETRAANISICKKIVNKIAQAYNHGVVRTVDTASDQDSIDMLSKETDFDTRMKKADRYTELFKNCQVQVIPEKDSRESDGESVKMKLKIKVVPPWSYDVLEDANDHEVQKVVILTEFVERNQTNQTILPGDKDGRELSSVIPQFHQGNGVDEIIADEPEDAGSSMRTFIWWSDNYHFTTDAKGYMLESTSPEDAANPIGIVPLINHHTDQDGEYWAQGGDDLIEGSILINKVITDMHAIAFHQGWGQMVITGKDIPKSLKTGPMKAVILEQQSADEPAPTVSFQSANPPLGDWMSMIEMYTALLLSTNNLSPRVVAGKLDSSNMAAGISMLIDQSESTVDIKDRQKLFKDKEPMTWEVLKRWHQKLSDADALSSTFAEIPTFTDSDVKLEFSPAQPIITEEEKLRVLQMRKDIGLDTMLDLIMKDKDISKEDAEAKLKEILKEKLERASQFMTEGMQDGQENDDEKETDEKEPKETPAKENPFKKEGK